MISQARYTEQRVSLLKQQADEVAQGYQSEIDALEAAKTKKSTTGVQIIQIDQKIADARTAMVKAQQDSDSGIRPAKSSSPSSKAIVSVRRLSPSAKQSNSSSRAAPAECAKPRSDLIRRLTGVFHRLSSPNQPTLQQRLQYRLG